MIGPNRNRLGAAASVATLGVALAAPGISSAVAASATPTLPDSGQLTTSLQTLVSASNAASLASEISALQSSPSASTLGALDKTLSPLLSSLSGLLGGLLPGTPLAQTFEATLGATAGLLPSGATAAQTQALNELNSALSTAGLSSLLAGLTSDSGASALSQLAALQNLAPGASTASGALTSVGQVVSELASEAGTGTDATSLTGAAAILNSSSATTPTQLLSAITALSSVTSTTASATSGTRIAQIATALASQLAQSGSLFGGLSSVGSSMSALRDPSDISTATSQLNALATATPGSTAGGGLGPILQALSQVNGIQGTPFGADLSTLAINTENEDGVVWQNEIDGINQLKANSASLPSPLNTLVANFADSLDGSGDFFGGLGLSDANRVSALTEMSQLSALGAGSSLPVLPGLGSVLDALAAQPPIAGTAAGTLLTELGTAISTNPISGPALGDVAAVLDQVAALLPAPLGTTVTNLGTKLTSVSTTVGATPSSTSTTTGTSTSSPGSTKSTSTGTGALARGYDWGLVRKVSRTGNAVTVTLYCFANPGKTCTNTMKATETGFHALTRKVTMNAGKTDRFTLKLKRISTKPAKSAAKHKVAKRATIKLSVVSGAYKAAKTLK
jgi:hypothetical protein